MTFKIKSKKEKTGWKYTSDWDRDLIQILHRIGESNNKQIEKGWRENLTLTKKMWGLPQNYMPKGYPSLKEWIKMKQKRKN